MTDHRRNRLLAALGAQAYEAVEKHLETTDLPSGKILCEPGAPIRHAYFLQDGVVSLEAVLPDGHHAEMAIFGREGVFGYAGSLVSKEAYGRYSVQIPGTASRIGAERLIELADAIPALRAVLRRYIEALLAQTFQLVACNAAHTLSQRCCRYLLAVSDRRDGSRVHLRHGDLARALSVQRTSLTSVLGTLHDSGCISQGRGTITILDKHALEAMSCGCQQSIRAAFERLLPGSFA